MNDPAPGTLLCDRYRLDRLLGRGGMGAVYAALDQQLGREVAVKVFPGSEASTRFVMEARAMARVEHPNVVGIFDVAVHDGAPFLVMERLLGESLEARWARAPIGMAELLEVFVGVCDGVAAAHHAGVVHRDLKPANVFLCQGKDGAPRPPKVLDFGVAKVNDAHLTSVSVAGAIVGSPRFMAPEQLRGADPTPALDVYAIGVMLYRAVSGRLPFDHAELMPLIAQIEAARPVPLGTLAPALSPSLVRWIEGAMAREPAARPGLAALRAGLEAERRSWTGGPSTMAVSSGTSVSPSPSALPGSSGASFPSPPARAPSRPRAATRPSTVPRALLGALAAGLGALLVLSGAFVAAGVYFSQRTPEEHDDASARGESHRESHGACQGASPYGELNGPVLPGRALCRLRNPAPPARVSMRSTGCEVPNGDYEAYFGRGAVENFNLTHVDTLSSFVISLEANASGRVDLSAAHRDGVPLYITFTRDSVSRDNGLSSPGLTGGHLVVERFDIERGGLRLRFEGVQLSDAHERTCILNGELTAEGYTAAFP